MVCRPYRGERVNTVCGYCGYLRVSITQSGKSVVVYFSFRDKTIPANTRNTRNYSTCDLLRRYITPTTKRKRVVYYKNCRSAQSVCQVHRRSALSVRTVGLPRPSSVCTVGATSPHPRRPTINHPTPQKKSGALCKSRPYVGALGVPAIPRNLPLYSYHPILGYSS